MKKTDYELVKICLKGDYKAFSEIVSRYKNLVYNVIYNYSINTTDAGDLSQEVFIRVFRSLRKYDPAYRFSTWIIKITTNLCIDWLREKKQESVSLDIVAEVSDNCGNPVENFEHREDLRILRKAIAELPDKYRIPVVLFHQQHLSYRELEKVLNEPESIIKNRLYRARNMLREKVQSSKEVS